MKKLDHSQIAVFRRDDGDIYDCVVGSASFEIFSKAKNFTRVDGDASAEPKPIDLTKMRKAELVAEAERRGIKVVPDEMTNKQIIAAIEAAQSPSDDAGDGEGESQGEGEGSDDK